MPHTHGTPGLYEVFLRVADEGSFTAAADALGYTQSAVSRQIQALEDELGAALFDRVPRGVRLTAAGHVLVPHARAVLDRITAARAELAALRRLDGGRLRLGAFATADAALVPRTLAAFRDRHPRVHVTRTEDFTPGLLDRVAAGDLDLAVVSSPGGAAAGQCVLHHLMDEPLYVAVPRGHRLAGRPRVRFAELADERWIAGGERPEDTLLHPALAAGHRPEVGYVVREWIAKQGFVAAGLGVTLLPALAAEAVRPDITLVPIDADDLPHRPVHAATPAGQALAPATARFLELLRESAAAVAASPVRGTMC